VSSRRRMHGFRSIRDCRCCGARDIRSVSQRRKIAQTQNEDVCHRRCESRHCADRRACPKYSPSDPVMASGGKDGHHHHEDHCGRGNFLFLRLNDWHTPGLEQKLNSRSRVRRDVHRGNGLCGALGRAGAALDSLRIWVGRRVPREVFLFPCPMVVILSRALGGEGLP